MAHRKAVKHSVLQNSIIITNYSRSLDRLSHNDRDNSECWFYHSPMSKFFTRPTASLLWRLPLSLSAAIASLSLSASVAMAQSISMYNPIPMPPSDEVTDVLSDQDIPTGFGGYARDYTLTLEDGDYIVIDLISDEFDTIITMLAPDGSTFGENDDGPDGTTNSMLFVRITQSGEYTLRVTPYAGQGEGEFNMKVTRLRPI